MKPNPTTIRVSNLGKAYELNLPTLKDAVNARLRRHSSLQNKVWALKNISFEVNQGEIFALLGPNGSGKSTLLKILSKIALPTEGSFSINGKVAAMLEVGCGFHPDLTGRENIWLSGSILGMQRHEIRRHFDAIVEFSEIGSFIDQRVRVYSSGMYLRLGFAVAVHMNRDVLLIDEAISFGDRHFQSKCLTKLSSLIKEGKTVILTSHDMGVILQYATRGLCLSKGSVIGEGAAAEAVSLYERECFSPGATAKGALGGAGFGAILHPMKLLDETGNSKTKFQPGESLVIEARITTEALFVHITEVRVETLEGSALMVVNSLESEKRALPAGTYTIRSQVPLRALQKGIYRVQVMFDSDYLPHNLNDCSYFQIEAPLEPHYYVPPVLSTRPSFECYQNN